MIFLAGGTEEEGQWVAEAERRIGAHSLEGGHSLRLVVVVLSHNVVVRLGGLHHKGTRVALVAQALAHGLGIEQLLELPYDEIIIFEHIGYAVAGSDEYALDARSHGVAADNRFGDTHIATVTPVNGLFELEVRGVLRRHRALVGGAVVLLGGFARGYKYRDQSGYGQYAVQFHSSYSLLRLSFIRYGGSVFLR